MWQGLKLKSLGPFQFQHVAAVVVVVVVVVSMRVDVIELVCWLVSELALVLVPVT